MKYFWMLSLALLLLFALPVWGADSGPPGDQGIELNYTPPLDPVPVLDAPDSLLTIPLAVIKIGSMSADESKKLDSILDGILAYIYDELQPWPNALQMRLTEIFPFLEPLGGVAPEHSLLV